MAVFSEQVPIGWEAKDFRLKDTDEKLYSPSDFKGKKGLLIIFSCNHCPYAKASWPLLIDLFNKFRDNIGFLAINPNDEITYPDDSFEAMKEKKVEWGITFPYLRDESQEVAKAYKAVCTPDPYLFKNDEGIWKLFYHGRINDNWQEPDQVKEKNLEDAFNLLLKGQDPPQTQPPSMGCSIKWS